MKINEQTPEEAFKDVLTHAGCSYPVRDAVDIRIISDVRSGTASCEGKSYKELRKIDVSDKKSGIIDSQNDAGGWPVLKSVSAPTDSDHDGMSDQWERSHGLNPYDASDRNAEHSSGYTALEVYINSLCGESIKGKFLK